MFRKILVAVDGSEGSHRAMSLATDLARKFDADLCLLHAFPHIADCLGSQIYDQMVQKHTLEGQYLLESLRQEILQMDDHLTIDTQLLEGAPATAILQVAEIEGMDLIVVGSRGHNALTNLLLGSVSTAVTQHAHCPVMVVH